MLFLLKIAITPMLVAGVSLASRWWGPTAGGILMGLPWFTGPVLFVLAHDKGYDFAVAACVGIQLAVFCLGAFILTYGFLAATRRWPVALAAAVGAFFVGAWVVQTRLAQSLLDSTGAPLLASAGTGLASLLATSLVLPRPRSGSVPQWLPWWDIPMRVVVTAALVAAIVLAADVLGPRLSGIMGTYPVILSVVGAFTHHRWGHDAVLRLLHGLTRSLVSFVAFFLVVGLALPNLGLAGSYALASAVAVAITAGLLFFNRRAHGVAPPSVSGSVTDPTPAAGNRDR